MSYYAVRVGKKPGIYSSWASCREQVHGYAGAQFKKFTTEEEAKAYMQDASAASENTIPENIPEGECHAYVDGSFNSKTRTFGYGVVFFSARGKETFFGSGKDEHARHRNIAGELRGAEKAMDLALAQHAKTLTIYHDYAGICHWALGEWKTNVPLTRAYAEKAKTVREQLTLRFVKVKAHTGNTYNEEADDLAKKGAGLVKKEAT